VKSAALFFVLLACSARAQEFKKNDCFDNFVQYLGEDEGYRLCFAKDGDHWNGQFDQRDSLDEVSLPLSGISYSPKSGVLSFSVIMQHGLGRDEQAKRWVPILETVRFRGWRYGHYVVGELLRECRRGCGVGGGKPARERIRLSNDKEGYPPGGRRTRIPYGSWEIERVRYVDDKDRFSVYSEDGTVVAHLLRLKEIGKRWPRIWEEIWKATEETWKSPR